MNDDLVKRLRDRDAYAKSNGWDNVVFGQAADRIEELEAALRKIAQHDMQSIALNALAQKISDPFADTTEKKDE